MIIMTEKKGKETTAEVIERQDLRQLMDEVKNGIDGIQLFTGEIKFYKAMELSEEELIALAK